MNYIQARLRLRKQSGSIKMDKQTLLLIEDDPTILNVHKIFLEKNRFLVDTAINGEEAFKKFKNDRYPLVLLDGGLPDMTGLELALRMREHEKLAGLSRTPLILLSGYTEQMMQDWCRVGDIDAYAIKPVHPVVLEHLVLQFMKV